MDWQHGRLFLLVLDSSESHISLRQPTKFDHGKMVDFFPYGSSSGSLP